MDICRKNCILNFQVKNLKNLSTFPDSINFKVKSIAISPAMLNLTLVNLVFILLWVMQKGSVLEVLKKRYKKYKEVMKNSQSNMKPWKKRNKNWLEKGKKYSRLQDHLPPETKRSHPISWVFLFLWSYCSIYHHVFLRQLLANILQSGRSSTWRKRVFWVDLLMIYFLLERNNL